MTDKIQDLIRDGASLIRRDTCLCKREAEACALLFATLGLFSCVNCFRMPCFCSQASLVGASGAKPKGPVGLSSVLDANRARNLGGSALPFVHIFKHCVLSAAIAQRRLGSDTADVCSLAFVTGNSAHPQLHVDHPGHRGS